MSDREKGYELAYREALRAISDRQRVLDSIQSRVGVVASASAIVLSLTAQRALQSGDLSVALLASLGSFLLSAISTGYVLWPRRKWRFHFGVDRLHSEYVENAQPLSAGLMMRDLAIHLDRYFRSNGASVDRISAAFAASLVALLVQAASFSYDVFGGL